MKTTFWRATGVRSDTPFYLYTLTIDSNIDFDKSQPKEKSFLDTASFLRLALPEDEHLSLAIGIFHIHSLQTHLKTDLSGIEKVDEIPQGLTASSHNGHTVWEQKQA